MELKEIDLSKSRPYKIGSRPFKTEHQDLQDHPDIVPDKDYLVQHRGKLYVGQFDYQWYGLNFYGIYDVGCQYDAPGTNSSGWERVWLIVPDEKDIEISEEFSRKRLEKELEYQKIRERQQEEEEDEDSGYYEL